jgi:hypothetical protein
MILTDTGYWLALANAKDKYHTRAIEVTQSIKQDLVITWPVITECCHLITTRLNPQVTVLFLQEVERNTLIFELQPDHIPAIKKHMRKYVDLPMDLADASLVIAAEELASGDILSTDQRDFETYRWKNQKPFRNLLLDA